MRGEVLRELSRSRTPVDRLRARTTALAAAGMGVALLAAASIAGLRSTEPTGITQYTVEDGVEVVEQQLEVGGGLAPFLQQDGLRPGTVLAAVLLVLPFAALALQALRVGSLALDRQAALLALAGATPGDLRRVRVRRSALAFALGGLLAGPLYALTWLALGPAVTPGWRLLPTPQAWLPLAWLAVTAALALVGAALALRPRARRVDPLSRGSAAAPPPGRAVAWITGLAALAVLYATLSSDLRGAVPAGAFLVATVLLLACAHAVVSRRAAAAPTRTAATGARLPRARPRLPVGRRNPAVDVLAAAQRRANPRACGAVAGVLFVCGLSFGIETALVTGLLLDEDQYDLAFYAGGAALAAVVGLVAATVALLALALSLTDHLLSARRSVAATAALGAELRRLRAVQDRALVATALPATVAGTLVAGLPYALLGVGLSSQRLVPSVAAVLAVAALAGLLVTLACRLVSFALTGRLRTAAALDHLRTP